MRKHTIEYKTNKIPLEEIITFFRDNPSFKYIDYTNYAEISTSGSSSSFIEILYIDEIESLRESLNQVITEKYIPVWLNTPLEELQSTPLQAIHQGKLENVKRIIRLLGSGMPT
jgi:hypothetical protein